MFQNKIIPSLWFNTDSGNISIVIYYHKYIFKSNFEVGKIMPQLQTPSGNTEMCKLIF